MMARDPIYDAMKAHSKQKFDEDCASGDIPKNHVLPHLLHHCKPSPESGPRLNDFTYSVCKAAAIRAALAMEGE